MQHVRQTLTKLGCKDVEFCETPEILQLSGRKLQERLDLLKRIQVAVTPVMVKLAEETNTSRLKRLIRGYQKCHDGHNSRARQLQYKLNLSDDDLTALAHSGAKLLHCSDRIKHIERLEWLRWKGYQISDITASPQVLDKPLDVLSRRHKTLTNFGVTRPPLHHLSGNSKQFDKLIGKLEASPLAAESIQVTGHCLHASSKALHKLPELQPKWEFLGSQGYQHTELRKNAKALLKVELETLQTTVLAAKSCPLVCVNLNTLINMCDGTLKKRKVALSALLQCPPSELPRSMRTSKFLLFYFREPASYLQNLQFLLERKNPKISISDLRYCPLLVSHRPAVLRHHWNMVQRHLPSIVTQLRDQPVHLLHLVQYEIEKEHDFVHPVIV